MAKEEKIITIHDSISDYLHRSPFQPFDLRTADGDTIHVRHPDFIARSPKSEMVTVYDTDGHIRTVQLSMVVTLEPVRPKPSKVGKK